MLSTPAQGGVRAPSEVSGWNKLRFKMSDTSTPARGPSKTGVAGLDDILNGGFTPDRLYLIDGDPGAGKTTLALQYLLEGAKQGEKCLYITLSETKEELSAGAASHGWSLEGIEIVELTPEAQDLNVDAQITMYPAAEMELQRDHEKDLGGR
jgi:circadian clock protein KaiC